jgi:hypothetical protein
VQSRCIELQCQRPLGVSNALDAHICHARSPWSSFDIDVVRKKLAREHGGMRVAGLLLRCGACGSRPIEKERDAVRRR